MMPFGSLRFDIVAYRHRFFETHKRHIALFAVLYAILIAIYGQRLFFYILPSDDYMRFWGDDNVEMLISNSARWAQALLNKYVFTGPIQILPYLHGLIGILCFTAMGYLSALYWGGKSVSEIVATVVLIAATPMFAHNLYFATNITTWLALLSGVIGFLLVAMRKGRWTKLVGFVFLIFSIGNYQSIVQIVALLILVKTLLHISDAKSTKEIYGYVARALVLIAVVAVAYAISNRINAYFMHMYHLHETHRLAQADRNASLGALWRHLKDTYTTPIPFLFFSKPLHFLFAILYGGGIVSGLYLVVRQKSDTTKAKLLKTIVWLIAFAAIPLIVNLPLIMGVDIPLRAHFPLGWAVAGVFVLSLVAVKGLLRTVLYGLVVVIAIVQIYYISIFFDGCARQTQADILRANAIVNRIRMDKEYEKEPIKFYIVGQKPFNVVGWDIKWQQPFDSYWAKYKIFRYFTDLRFEPMNRRDLNEIERYLVERGEPIYSYPGKNSVVVYHNKAVLFLNPDKINILIKKHRDLKKIPLERTPDVHATFDLYIEDNILFYYKKPCTEEEIRRKFFLRIYPKDPAHTVISGKRGLPFATRDFRFSLFGERKDDRCVAAIELPTSFEIAKIRTGQFGDNNLTWDVTYTFHKENNRGD